DGAALALDEAPAQAGRRLAHGSAEELAMGAVAVAHETVGDVLALNGGVQQVAPIAVGGFDAALEPGDGIPGVNRLVDHRGPAFPLPGAAPRDALVIAAPAPVEVEQVAERDRAQLRHHALFEETMAG